MTKRLQFAATQKMTNWLELAVCGNADFLVTGDKDLLVLNPFRGVEIITPREFLEKAL